MLVGVQSNQFPRALDIARPLREHGIQVAIGGFHASGVLSMLQGKDPDLDRARALGVSNFADEAEGRLEEVLRDAAAGAAYHMAWETYYTDEHTGSSFLMISMSARMESMVSLGNPRM